MRASWSTGRGTLVDGNPTRERLWGLLMSALYRSGRGEEAIAVYAEARATLADELGIEPSEALQQLEAGILRTDPALGEVAGHAAAQPRRRARIPVLASTTYGRDELVGEVSALLSSPDVRLVTLTGIGGSGKSRVATLTATAVQSEYTDVAYLQVTEASAGPQLAVEITLALGCAATDDLATSLSALAPEQRALVVLDNLEALAEGPEIVRRLLDASAQVTVLVTSRLPLRVPGEHELPVPPLEVPGIAADVDTIAEAASVQLFVDRAMSAEPSVPARRPGARRRRGVRDARRAAARHRAGRRPGQAAQPRPHHRRVADQPGPARHRLGVGARAPAGDDDGDPLELRPADLGCAARV